MPAYYRKQIISKILDTNLLNSNELSANYLINLVSLLKNKLFFSEELEIATILSKLNLNYLIKNQAMSEFLEFLVTSFNKSAILNLEIRIVSKFNDIIKSSNGMYLLNKILLTNSI